MNTQVHPVHRARWILLGLTLLLTVLVALPALRLARIAGAARRLKADIAAVRSAGVVSGSAASLEPARALRQDLTALEQDLRALRRSIAWLSRPLSRLSWCPALSAWGLVLDGGLGAASELSTAAWWVSLSVESAIENLDPGASGPPSSDRAAAESLVGPDNSPASPTIDAALQSLAKERSRLLQARADLARAQRGFDLLPGRQWLGSGRAEAWSGYLRLATLGLDALLALPSAAQPGQEHTWLILIQNSDELRATGGLISSVAVARFQGSDLLSLRYMNSYDVESYTQPHPAPPAPLQTYMNAGVLLFRDANWSPDYPSSAEVLAALYSIDMGESVDGIMAIDTTFVKLLLAALGPIYIPQYDVTVTSENVVETAIGFWNAPLDAPSIAERQMRQQEWMAHRKDFGGALIQAGLGRLADLSPSDLLQLGRTLQRAVAGKHLLAWAIDDPTLQRDLRRAGLDGGIARRSGDYLMVVDSNVGWNKADRYVDRAMDYHVVFTPEGPRARLAITYKNRADVQLDGCVHRAGYQDSYDALAKQCYWNYVRVLVPRGSVLRSTRGAEGPFDLGAEGDKMVVGALLVVPPGSNRTLVLEYDLPRDFWPPDGPYSLYVQKQPGPAGVQVSVTAELVSGAFRAVAPWALASRQQARYIGALDSDLILDLSWNTTGR